MTSRTPIKILNNLNVTYLILKPERVRDVRRQSLSYLLYSV